MTEDEVASMSTDTTGAGGGGGSTGLTGLDTGGSTGLVVLVECTVFCHDHWTSSCDDSTHLVGATIFEGLQTLRWSDTWHAPCTGAAALLLQLTLGLFMWVYLALPDLPLHLVCRQQFDDQPA
jgi:hypothetical protein